MWLWGVLQADRMVWQGCNVPVVLVPAFQEAEDGVEEEKEDEEEDDIFLQAHTKDRCGHLHFMGRS